MKSRTPSGPLRGLARSHRYSAAPGTCAVPVGAGVPAKGPAQPSTCFSYIRKPPTTRSPRFSHYFQREVQLQGRSQCR
ncbi:hypothetical protein FPB55_24695 [Pseudomonas sp. BJP69]|nr:hypothetical protein FPB55_24695 [Pseudomonas sp. BJP69]